MTPTERTAQSYGVKRSHLHLSKFHLSVNVENLQFKLNCQTKVGLHRDAPNEYRAVKINGPDLSTIQINPFPPPQKH